VAAARTALRSAPGNRRLADSLLRMAEENLDLVRNGKPAHNVAFADQLLRAAVDLTREAVKAGGVRYTVPKLDLGKPADEGGCSSCHLGAERATVPFKGGGNFPHEPHTLRAQLRCADCHTPLDQHGGTKLADKASCQACHHNPSKPIDCATCHRGGAGAPGKKVMTVDGASFPHAAHQQALPSCAPCHAGAGMKVTAFKCADCHDKHHAATAGSCASCHQGDILGKHDGFAEEVHAATPPCATCHEVAQDLSRWTVQTCTACHANKASGHYEKAAKAARGCEACHDLKAIGAGKP
jgi:hypothetical protein